MSALVVDVLAAYRLARLARTDEITLPLRDAVESRSVQVRAQQDGEGGWKPSTIHDVQPWAFVRDMLDCGWCTTVWTSALVMVLPRRARRLLAVAALAGIATRVVEVALDD